jgi:citrate lyase subunit beta / citryl-CoA lyase
LPAGCADAQKAGQMSGLPEEALNRRAARMRSFLFVPGDSERKQVKALQSGADALILDLEDSVDVAQLDVARAMVRGFLEKPPAGGPQLWVRLNSLASGKLADDAAAVMAGRPAGVVLPKVSSPAEVVEIDRLLSGQEARHGIAPGSTRIVVIATETPAALFALGGYAGGAAGPRLVGLTWGVEDLSAALGALEKATADGALTPVLQLARSLCLLGAVAAGVQAIDGVYPNFRDRDGLALSVAEARRDGFTAKLAIHPDQVPAINAAFTPTEAEVERARRIVAAFEAAGGAGVASLDGQMIDRPHLVLARRVLERAKT